MRHLAAESALTRHAQARTVGICLRSRRSPAILFDESHSEAWTIRRELASRCSPPTPRTPPTLSPPRRSPAAISRSSPNAERPLTRETLAAADVLVIAHPSDPRWEATTNSRTPRLSDRELDAIEEFVRGGGGLIALGETEQAKYGNNLNDLLARFGIEVANCTVQDYEHYLSAPSWVLAELENGSDGELENVDLLARVHQACFYRTGALALHNGGRVIARSSPSASPPEAPLAAITEHGAGRVVVLADSDLFGDDCIGELDNESLWLNLVYWAAQPAFAGVADRDRLAGPLRPELGGAQGRGRGAAPDPGARRLGRHLRARRRPPHRARRNDLERRPEPGAPLPPPKRTTSTPCATTCAPGSTPASPSPTSFAPWRRFGRSATGAMGSSTWWCSRCTSRTPRARPASRR